MTLRHYVPNFILRNFADDNDVLWVLDKETRMYFSDKGAANRRYRAFAEHGYNPWNTESVLSDIESSAAPVIEQLIEHARCGLPPELDPTSKGRLCTFLLVQSLRIPRVKNWIMSKQWEYERDKQMLWQMFSELKNGNFPAGLEADAADPTVKDHDQLEKVFWLRMMEMNIFVATVGDRRGDGLIVGDEPCLMRRYLVRSGDVVVMPLASDVWLELSRPEDSPGGLGKLDRAWTHALNLQSYKKAHRFVAGTSEDCLREVVAASADHSV